MVKAKSALDSQRRMGALAGKIIETIQRRFPLVEAYVFGSRARGDYLDTSDLDLVFVFQEMRSPKLELMEEVSRFISGKVDFIVMSPQEAKESRVVRAAKKIWDKEKGFDPSIFYDAT
jgi:predicted nucleotidyltransferase